MLLHSLMRQKHVVVSIHLIPCFWGVRKSKEASELVRPMNIVLWCLGGEWCSRLLSDPG